MSKRATTADRYLLAGKFQALQRNFDRAIELFTEGLAEAPDDARLFRHRGHRHLNQRHYREGLADLEAAARLIEGTPDTFDYFTAETVADIENLLLDRPISDPHLEVTPETTAATSHLYKSTLHFSVYYHLALARFLLRDYGGALSDYRRALSASIDDDARSAVNDWIYMTLLRLGREEEAAAHLDALDTDGYLINEETPLYVNRLRLYKGEISPEELRRRAAAKPLSLVTAEFAIAQWHLHAGRHDDARTSFDRLLEQGDRHSFAYLVAERDQNDILNS